MNLPNTLTAARIVLVPVLVSVLLTKFEGRLVMGIPVELVAAAIFGIASLTDWLDGYLARRRKQAGQLASKMRFLAAPWLGVLEDGAWLRHAAHANAMAQRLGSALAALPQARLLAPVQANGVFVDLPAHAIASLHARGWHLAWQPPA